MKEDLLVDKLRDLINMELVDFVASLIAFFIVSDSDSESIPENVPASILIPAIELI